MKISSHGQVTIPLEWREQYSLFPDTEVEMVAGEDGILIRPVHTARLQMEHWLQKARGSATKKMSTDEIMELSREED